MNRFFATHRLALLGFAAALGLALPVLAQHQHHNAPPKAAPANPAVEAYKAANARMHKDMDITFTGNADKDFAKGMVPHHQGAVDMAKVVLTHGKDPELRKLAQEIIEAQEKELTILRDWLKKNP
jgi:uncharacterized protein (DUF305 family)